MKFNINDKVRVKLTDHGRKVYRDDHFAFWQDRSSRYVPSYVPPKEDAEGWSEWQLHALMAAFGSYCHMGSPVPFETTIELVLPQEQPQ